MQAEIITIGDEILIGQIVDSNSAYIGKELNKIGISVYQITSIQDDRDHILKTLKGASDRVDIIIITGGLGPTKDDITKKCLLEYFDDTLVRDEKTLKHIEHLFEKYIDTPISNLNRDQALLPSKATILHNEYGTAAGMWFHENGTVFISMPGVPYEMKGLMEREVIPKLAKTFKRPFIVHKTIITLGLGESAIAEKIENWEDNLPSEIRLAYLPNLGRVRLRLTGRGNNLEVLEKAIDGEIEKLHLIIGDIIYGLEDEDEPEVLISKLLQRHHWTLSFAESCTGGKLASKFTTNPGSSNIFKGAVVSYATEAKQDILGISEEIIDKHSVVSAEVAEAMAKAAKNIFKTDFAISTTGNAGPDKGDSDAEIGTVFIGIATPTEVFSKQYNFGNLREKVVGKAVNKSVELLREQILKAIALDDFQNNE